ncbi:hypothetical protein PIB30_086908, partial [Stylosanthes scabra]|nr:hypothetical protein [Stylosanthes scabra]
SIGLVKLYCLFRQSSWERYPLAVVLLARFGILAEFRIAKSAITPSPPSPPPSDDEPSVETYDPVTELDAPYGLERESASADIAASSNHSSGSSSSSVSLGYGSASIGSASDSASDDDLVNRYFAETFPLP